MEEMQSKKRIAARVGGVAAVLLVIWCFRAEPNLPDVGEGQLFCERPTPTAVGMVEMEMDSSSGAVDMQVREAAEFDPTDMGIGGSGSRSSSRSGSAFATPQPQRLPASHSASRSSSDRRGLFDSTALDPFAEKDAGSDTPSWGWLADEVGTSDRAGIRDLSTRRASERRRSLLDDRDDGRFRTELDSGGGFRFRRMDERF